MRIKDIQKVCSARAAIDAGNAAQAHVIHLARVVVDVVEGASLDIVHPEGQAAVIGACSRGGQPVNFQCVDAISNRDPRRVAPGSAVVYQAGAHLIVAKAIAHLNSGNLYIIPVVCGEQVKGVVVRHGDPIGIEVEPERLARKFMQVAYTLSKANRPAGQSTGQYVRRQLDRLGIGAELTEIPWGTKNPPLPLPPSSLKAT